MACVYPALGSFENVTPEFCRNPWVQVPIPTGAIPTGTIPTSTIPTVPIPTCHYP